MATGRWGRFPVGSELGSVRRDGYITLKIDGVVRGQQVYLGSHATVEDAHQAYLRAKRQLHAGCTL